MVETDLLITRLEQIGRSLAASGKASALIGLGSAGAELERLDRYSDLDFFVLAKPGLKRELIEDLGWLSSICPVAYAFRNSPDGYKLLFEDGVFCEFAIFEEPELRRAAYAAARFVWKQPGVPEELRLPQQPAPPQEAPPLEWLLGEALTNLYVGLGRFHRGERLSAMRFIQGYAVDRLLDLAPRLLPESSPARDVFSAERRFEARYPALAQQLPAFLPGYTGSLAGALAILDFLEAHFEINPAIKSAIRALCEPERRL